MAAGAPRSPTALLRDRTFGPFFFGNLISNSGAWIHNVAAAVVVFELTGSATYTGGVSAALWLGSLLLQPYAGALSDRLDRRRMLIGGQTVALLSATALTTLSAAAGGADQLPGPWPVIGATAGIGLGVALSMPAMQALVPALVPARDLDQAIALGSLTFNLARAAGPAASAAILLLGDATIAFGVNAASYAALIGALLVIQPRVVDHGSSYDRGVLAGLRHVRADRAALLLLVGTAGVGFASDPVNTLTPLLAAEFGAGEALVGLMVSAFGLGAALTAMRVGALRGRFGQRRIGEAGGLILAAGILTFAVSPAPAVAIAGMAVAGSGFLLSITSHNTRLQREVPEWLRGRVMALWGVAFLGSRPLSALLDGGLADLTSGRLAAAVFGGFALVSVLAARAVEVE